MPASRMAMRRGITNENDENGTMSRVTRSKAAANHGPESADDIKKPLQARKTATNAQPLRKRGALGDISNVTKVGDAVDGKKAAGKGLVSKVTQSAAVQPPARSNATRPVLGSKDLNKKAVSKTTGGAVLGSKRKIGATTSITVKEEATVDDEQPSRKKIHREVIETRVRVEEDIKPESTKDNVTKLAQAPPKEPVDDLDQEDLEDPLMCAEYVVEIFEYLKELEIKTRPNADYMDHQEDLEWKMRGILVDWLVEVHTRFHLLPETLFLAVNIIDRFLSAKMCQLDRLQLVGVTAMFIASKYEEVLSPHVANFRHVADDGFTEAEILSAERFVLQALNYDLSYPNPMNFLRRISKADNYDIQTRTIGKYLLEISLLDERFMEFLPSHVAAAAMFTSRSILERGPWDATLDHYAGYTEEEMEPVVNLMIDYLARPIAHDAFFKKYASKKFLKASILTRAWAKKRAIDMNMDVSERLHL